MKTSLIAPLCIVGAIALCGQMLSGNDSSAPMPKDMRIDGNLIVTGDLHVGGKLFIAGNEITSPKQVKIVKFINVLAGYDDPHIEHRDVTYKCERGQASKRYSIKLPEKDEHDQPLDVSRVIGVFYDLEEIDHPVINSGATPRGLEIDSVPGAPIVTKPTVVARPFKEKGAWAGYLRVGVDKDGKAYLEAERQQYGLRRIQITVVYE